MLNILPRAYILTVKSFLVNVRISGSTDIDSAITVLYCNNRLKFMGFTASIIIDVFVFKLYEMNVFFIFAIFTFLMF